MSAAIIISILLPLAGHRLARREDGPLLLLMLLRSCWWQLAALKRNGCLIKFASASGKSAEATGLLARRCFLELHHLHTYS